MSSVGEGRRAGPGESPRGDLRIASVARGAAVRILVDGQEVPAFDGDSVASALIAARQRIIRWTARGGEPRGYFCGTGICRECLVTVDGRPDVRACVTPARDGLRVERQRGRGDQTSTP